MTGVQTCALPIYRFLSAKAVKRSKKPVYWCASCQTALAEAEVDYADIASHSIYVKFPLQDDPGDIDPALADEIGRASCRERV